MDVETNIVRRIRKNVFKASQGEFAVIIGVRQATVSRWETGEAQPRWSDVDKMRAEALKRRLEWEDTLVFTNLDPDPTPATSPATEAA